MSHRDFAVTGVRLNAACLQAALNWLLNGVDWSGIRFRQDCTWTPRLLTAVSLLWAWSDELTLVERFASARRLTAYLWTPANPLAESYQCFTKLLRRWTEPLLLRWQAALRERLPRELAQDWSVLGWVLFGVDGSRCELPRTRSHERAYAANRPRPSKKSRRARKHRTPAAARKANSPQLWLTTMFHVGSGLPWDWRIGPADSSERAHLLEMLPQLPPQALIAADAGFVGYEYLRAIVGSGRQLLIRVGSNVRLLRKLGYARESQGTVYLWPDKAAQRHQPPLVLRLVQAHTGRQPLFVVTSVVSPTRLTDRQVLELYARRWGIELFYRHLKQTFQRRKLRSTSASHALLELHWSLAGLGAMALYALVQLAAAGLPLRRLSIAHTLRSFRRLLRDYLHPSTPGHALRQRLSAALIDQYRRGDKTSRNYPRQKQESPPGPPLIIAATRTQRQLAHTVRHKPTQKG